MKKTITYLLVIPFLCLHISSFSMDQAGAPQAAQPLFAVNGELVHIPDTFNFVVPGHVWFSGVGAFISCLGGLLLYKGVQKTAQPKADTNPLNPQPESSAEGTRLMGGGALLLFAGLFTIWLNK